LLTNIQLEWKCMARPNTQAYYDTATITTIRSFKVQTYRVSQSGKNN
jgi:hypothetical protein